MKKIFAMLAVLAITFLYTTHSYGADKKTFRRYGRTWVMESSSDKASVRQLSGSQWDIVAPGGMTLWYDSLLTGRYEVSYSIKVVVDGGEYDRLSDMNCFWGAKDPQRPKSLYARAKWRGGDFGNYNTLKLFYVGYGGNENKTTRFREYHGELYGADDSTLRPILKEYTDPGHLLVSNHWYRITIKATDNITTYSCDGEEMFSLPITAGQTDGHFAIRLWKNHVIVKDFTVKPLK